MQVRTSLDGPPEQSKPFSLIDLNGVGIPRLEPVLKKFSCGLPVRVKLFTDTIEDSLPACGLPSINLADDCSRSQEMICPKCHSRHVKAFQRWLISDRKRTRPPKPMWGCLELTCLYKWARHDRDEPVAPPSEVEAAIRAAWGLVDWKR